MTDLDQRVRERLHEDADAFLRRRGPAPMPTTMARRIRRRQAVTLATVLVLAAGAAVGAFALASTLSGRPGEQRPASTGEMRRVHELDEAPGLADPGFDYPWRGLWPEVTEPAARAAQESASQPGSEGAWRLSAKSTAAEYARDVFRWTGVIGVDEDLDGDDAQRLRVHCPECGPAAEAEVILERVRGLGMSTIWSVTGLRVPQTPQGDELARVAVEDLVRRRATALTSSFLLHRVQGSTLAEEFLAPEAAATYRDHVDGLYLFGAPTPDERFPGHPDGHPNLGYGGFDVRIEPRPLGDGTLETVISFEVFDADDYDPMVGPRDGPREVLRIAPRDGRLVIVSAARFTG